ncbi:formylglycine-generating enzyme family protein [Nocardiopsis chromatogenes]|uniref:formylglycine-generating enzyme family protein n=1 Tax=Nocardiopsis chromatogenes TaxID=280239 RepID=UPI00034C7C3A|nr:SUMF1/EgtB/PvdO family nonheme iron enzyme [Nocardiopsis chromatogenes]
MQHERPLTWIDHHQAARAAEDVGGRIPTGAEWEWMAGGGHRRYPWGDADPDEHRANLRGAAGMPTPPWDRRLGATPEGLLDVAGNVWEWTSTTVPGDGAQIRGGSYNSIPLYATCTFVAEAPRTLKSRGIGVRPVREVPPCRWQD